MYMGHSSGILAAGIAVDPSHPTTLYASIDSFAVPSDGGVWKSSDGGATWRQLPTLDYPLRVIVDPRNSQHLYATDGVSGMTFGFWVSTDGGDSWTQPAGFTAASMLPKVMTSDAYSMSADPSDFSHVLLAFHSGWAGSSTQSGILESKDAGNTWTAHPPPSGASGEGFFVEFLFNPALGLGDKNTWLLGTQQSGYWKTTNAGQSWTNVSTVSMAHEGMHTYYAKNGAVYVGANGTAIRSTDNGSSWSLLDITGAGTWVGYYATVFGDGTNLYAQQNGFIADTPQPYYTSPETDGVKWTTYDGASQTFLSGPMQMAFDPANNILYSALCEVGVWALKTK